jgi:hypothetical protein
MSSRTDGTRSNDRAAAGGGKRGGQMRRNSSDLTIPRSLAGTTMHRVVPDPPEGVWS